MEIKISPAVARQIRRDVVELQELERLIAVKAQSNKAWTDVIVEDAGQRPSDFIHYELVELNGEPHLRLHLKVQPPKE
jgi:hypothetical protein